MNVVLPSRVGRIIPYVPCPSAVPDLRRDIVNWSIVNEVHQRVRVHEGCRGKTPVLVESCPCCFIL